MNTKIEQFKMEISMEHVQEDLIDVPVVVEVEMYKGSTEGFTSDDPSEVEALSVKLAEDYKTDTCILTKGSDLTVDYEMEQQIIRYVEEQI